MKAINGLVAMHGCSGFWLLQFRSIPPPRIACIFNMENMLLNTLNYFLNKAGCKMLLRCFIIEEGSVNSLESMHSLNSLMTLGHFSKCQLTTQSSFHKSLQIVKPLVSLEGSVVSYPSLVSIKCLFFS